MWDRVRPSTEKAPCIDRGQARQADHLTCMLAWAYGVSYMEQSARMGQIVKRALSGVRRWLDGFGNGVGRQNPEPLRQPRWWHCPSRTRRGDSVPMTRIHPVILAASHFIWKGNVERGSMSVRCSKGRQPDAQPVWVDGYELHQPRSSIFQGF